MKPACGLFLLLSASLVVQHSGPSIDVSPPFHGVFVADTDTDGSVTARAHRYKLAFGADGAIYRPLFGSRAPRD